MKTRVGCWRVCLLINWLLSEFPGVKEINAVMIQYQSSFKEILGQKNLQVIVSLSTESPISQFCIRIAKKVQQNEQKNWSKINRKLRKVKWSSCFIQISIKKLIKCFYYNLSNYTKKISICKRTDFITNF